ncbi:delta-like protein D isoform X2 [Ruditapes philippinarum]|uniref:delta-like protein D isoform X2 n=1 Tax=Ruditapes philippinarum TaxID=129788 RepID=UPI00295A9873|nr:delta-like protein D isoform X2 [Ruditapes philippinarum]
MAPFGCRACQSSKALYDWTDVNPCHNGGNCVDKTIGYYCMCPPGYRGFNCEYDLNKCLNNPCENGGRCENQINRRTCHCADGFEGTNCEKDDPTLMIVVLVCTVLVLVIIVVASTNGGLNAIHKRRKLRKIDGKLSVRYEGNEEAKNPKHTAFY